MGPVTSSEAASHCAIVRVWYTLGLMHLLPALASISLAVAVACGAFGAHALRSVLSPSDLAIWEKAVLYQLIHSLGALVLTLNANPVLSSIAALRIAWLLLASTLIFSGSLYLLVLLQVRWLGAITPLGGTGFIISWLLLALNLTRAAKAPSVVNKTEHL